MSNTTPLGTSSLARQRKSAVGHSTYRDHIEDARAYPLSQQMVDETKQTGILFELDPNGNYGQVSMPGQAYQSEKFLQYLHKIRMQRKARQDSLVTIAEGKADISDPTLLNRISVLSADGTFRDETVERDEHGNRLSILAGTALPHLNSSRERNSPQQLQQHTSSRGSDDGVTADYLKQYAANQDLAEISNSLGHIKDVHIEHGPSKESNLRFAH